MISTKNEKFLIMLKHSSRELQQIMLAVNMQLEAREPLDEDTQELINTIESTFKTIEHQIEEISNYIHLNVKIFQPINLD